jgi:hypothetical protein
MDPLYHYLGWGASEGRRPHLLFDGEWYRRRNSDVGDMNPLVHYLRTGRAEGRRIQKRAVVYCAITGAYDRLRPPISPDPDLDYIAFAEDFVPVPDPWIRSRIPRRFVDNRRTSRFLKTHAHTLLPGYDISVWVDGAFQLRNLKAKNLDLALGPAHIAFFQHDLRDCAYAEAEVVSRTKLDSPESVAWTVKQLEAHAYPRRAGMVATGLVVQRPKSQVLMDAMEEWWHMILNGSQRDQLSINFVLWKHKIQYAVIPGVVRRNKWVYWMGHEPATWSDVQRWSQFLENEILDLQSAIEASKAPDGGGPSPALHDRKDLMARSKRES